MKSAILDEVASIMRQASAEAIMPRFRRLQSAQIEEKTPGEVVTIADRAAERIMTPLLLSLLPGSRVVGEEAAADTPAILRGLDEGDVWLVDPLDGTANFVAGTSDFAVMVALLRHGQLVASWILAPTSGRLAVACEGAGAFLDGVRIRTNTASCSANQCRGAVLTRFLPQDLKRHIQTQAHELLELLPGTRCSGVDYPRVALGAQQFVMFWRLLPWDHAPGALFVAEAGGHVARLDGSGYHPSDQRPGLLVAENRETWGAVHKVLLEA